MQEWEGQPELYRLLVENSLGLMCVHDVSGVLLSINPAVTNSLGFPPGFGVGRNLRTFLVPAVRHLFDDYLLRLQRRGRDSGLMRLVARDGTERIWMYRNTLYARADLPPWVLGQALDITDRIRAERSLKEAQAALRKMNAELARRVDERTAELQRANQLLHGEIEQRKQMEEELLRTRKLESLGVLAGGIAHDFNNFLTIVQGNVELVRTQIGADDPVQEVLQQVVAACGRAALLSSQLLTFAKGGSPIRRVVPMAKLVLDAVSLARAGAATTINVDLAADLWPAEIDATQIGQVLHNVLLNARQAMPEAGIIEVRAENVTRGGPGDADNEPFVRIAIRDYGTGIAPDVLPRVFDPYFTTKASGHGLGLATAYAVVAKHGGHISVESKLGEGTVFVIDLPACRAASAPAPAAVAGGAQERITGKLLVMDDEDALRKLLERVLKALGHAVQSARDGAEAIVLYEAAMAERRPFDAVLLDLTVRSGLGGIETASRLRALDPAARLIVSSGYFDAPVMSEHLSYGFDGMVAKPWTPAQLDEVFQMVLAKARDRRLR